MEGTDMESTGKQKSRKAQNYWENGNYECVLRSEIHVERNRVQIQEQEVLRDLSVLCTPKKVTGNDDDDYDEVWFSPITSCQSTTEYVILVMVF